MQAPRHTRVNDAYRQIKEEIRTNRMPPGFQAPEPEIALRLGMSRTPVREALIRLEAEGLVELVPRRGARVLPLHSSDMREIYEILTAMEPEAAAALAARRPSDRELAPLDDATTAMELALADQDLDAWAAADDLFHQLLLELHGNQRLIDYIGTLNDQAHRARMVTLRMRSVPHQSTADHRDILEHIRAGDAEAARRSFRNHRQHAAEELLAILDTYRLSQL
ncbi:GntR family transcriptional regulator [Marinovum sp. 2_MG-2023]|uniref:GntR family transcriptional regulator n=1 Tax=unclassified Marinovum TaxID=2647166 RepID=UPI0026E19CDB|nr:MULTISPECIES: GntR family transcriptional regulator [unclassified Marinovum]MDO6730878.1 GntR family transcriptional regulator [Marinovum sp. 2_MG-2023]MDO6780105.1 GntR family transcriptional regulator [Marinovum sp. 1_MG-2023]